MDDYIVQHRHLQSEPYLDAVRRMYRQMGFGPLPEPTPATIAGRVQARINHGRWMVACAACNSALVIDLMQPVYYMCVECGNAGNGGGWLQVTLPRNWRAIEAELLRRPHGRNPADAPTRNWEPGETVADLRRENAEHGIGG